MKKNSIVKNIFDYLITVFINKSLSLIILPVVTRFLMPEEYAIYSLLMLFAAFASLIYQAGLQQSLMTYYHDSERNNYQFTLISTIYISILFIGLIFTLIIITFRNPLFKLLIDTDSISQLNYTHLLVWTAFLILFDVFRGVTLVLLNIMHKSRSYSFLALTKNIFTLILIIVSAIMNALSINMLLAVLLFSSFVALLHSIYCLKSVYVEIIAHSDQLKIFSIKLLRKLLRFGLYMIPGTFAILILQAADRYMLNFLSIRKLYDVGIYTAAYKIGMILSLLTAVFDLVFFPYILKQAKSVSVKDNLKKIYFFYIIVCGFLGSLVILFSNEIFLALDSSYAEGSKIVFVGVISIFLKGIFNIFVLGFYILKQPRKIVLGLIIGSLLNIGMNFLLIPRFGVYGAGISSILAYFCIVVYNYLVAERIYFVGYKFYYVILAFFVLLILSVINYVLPFNWTVFGLKIIIVLILSGSIIFMLRKNDKILYLISIIRNKGIHNNEISS